ncbi:MAG TPA: hypothetical protein VHK69_21385 [Chitinophagaceae bacterium]|jgi:opacity protein-like surface antigen|nr:hypothetical protein [Chitinophagaceae bacterium]
MKKKLFAIAAAFLMISTATFAAGKQPVPGAVQKSLTRTFGTATDIQWKTTDNFFKASFVVNDRQQEAFFDVDGSLIAVSRNVFVNQLPASLQAGVKGQETGFTVTSLFELVSEKGTEYYISYSNGKETQTYKSGGEVWTRY